MAYRDMLASKTFVKKTKKGSVVKVVREHYLRDDVWCGVVGCGVCKQGEKAVLEADPSLESSLCPQSHLLLPDTNVVLHQIDFFEDAAIKNVILLQIVLQEVICYQIIHCLAIEKVMCVFSVIKWSLKQFPHLYKAIFTSVIVSKKYTVL